MVFSSVIRCFPWAVCPFGSYILPHSVTIIKRLKLQNIEENQGFLLCIICQCTDCEMPPAQPPVCRRFPKGIIPRRKGKRRTGGNVAALAGLRLGVMAMNNADNFLLFLGGNPDEFQCFTSAAVGADECAVIFTGKCRGSGVFLSTFRTHPTSIRRACRCLFLWASANCRFQFFHTISPLSLISIASRRCFKSKPKRRYPATQVLT